MASRNDTYPNNFGYLIDSSDARRARSLTPRTAPGSGALTPFCSVKRCGPSPSCPQAVPQVFPRKPDGGRPGTGLRIPNAQ